MADLVATRAAVIACHADASGLDALDVDGTLALRVAPDEALLVAEPDSATTVLASARSALGEDAEVLDATDGWAMWTLEGDDARGAFERVSALVPPETGFVQGEVAHVPAKVLAAPGRVHVLVASSVAWYVGQRLTELDSVPVDRRADDESWFKIRRAAT